MVANQTVMISIALVPGLTLWAPTIGIGRLLLAAIIADGDSLCRISATRRTLSATLCWFCGVFLCQKKCG